MLLFATHIFAFDKLYCVLILFSTTKFSGDWRGIQRSWEEKNKMNPSRAKKVLNMKMNIKRRQLGAGLWVMSIKIFISSDIAECFSQMMSSNPHQELRRLIRILNEHSQYTQHTWSTYQVILLLHTSPSLSPLINPKRFNRKTFLVSMIKFNNLLMSVLLA